MDSVVEIARILPVDGDERELAQILPALEVGVAHPGGKRRRLRHRLVGPRNRQLVRANRDVDLHARQHPGPQHLLDGADRRVAPRRRLGDARDDVVAVARIGARVRRNEDVVMDPRVVGAHEGDAALAPQAPDHLRDAPLDDLDQRPFAAPVAIDLHHAGHYPIPVHQPAHVPRREEQIGARVVGPDESEPVPVSDDASGDEVHPIDEPELAAAVADDLAVTLHGREPALQRLLLGGGPEGVRAGDPVELDGGADLAEKLDQRTAFRQVRDTFADAARSVAAWRWRAR